ncbi:MAG: hypothetical protein ACFFAL_09520 [Promethearchaeota archaeon]
MLYLAETPLHFGLVFIICILTLIVSLIAMIMALRSEKPSCTLYNLFLAAFFAFLTFLVLAISIYVLPAAATLDQLLPTYLGAWSFIGLHSFFFVMYILGLPFFKRRIWTIFLSLVGTISFLALVWILPLVTPATIVSDGVANFLAMPFTLVAYGGFLAIFYLLLIPLIVLYRIAQARQGMAKTWTWIAMIGQTLWFIGLILLALVQYTAPFILFTYGLIIIAGILIILSIYFVIVSS